MGLSLSPQLLSSSYHRALIMIYVWINTYNRPDELNTLLSDIERDIGSHEHIIRIYNDGSNKEYSINSRLNIKYSMTHHHGKKMYWGLLNIGMSEIRNNKPFEYYIRLDDDVRLVDGFFNKIINIWEGITNPNKVSLFPLLDSREGQKVWTGQDPILIEEEKVYDCGWVDDMYLCNRRFFEGINFEIPPISQSRWKKNPNLSTGTGRYVSKTLYNKGLKMYLVTETLIYHHERTKEHPSVMNPKNY